MVGFAHKDSRPLFVVAGDLFHHHTASPELISLALNNLPEETLAVAGNHDLPNHNLAEIGRTALGTLIAARRLDVLGNSIGGVWEDADNNIVLSGFNWNEPLADVHRELEATHPRDAWKHVAVVHKYCWREGHTFPGADPEGHVQKFGTKLAGYRLAVIGDNHQPFQQQFPRGGPLVYNHGAAVRRRIDERNICLGLGLLWDDGHFENLLYEPEEKWVDLPETATCLFDAGIDARELLQTILDLSEQSDDFEDAMGRVLAAVTTPQPVRKLLGDWLEKARKRIGR